MERGIDPCQLLRDLEAQDHLDLKLEWLCPKCNIRLHWMRHVIEHYFSDCILTASDDEEENKFSCLCLVCGKWFIYAKKLRAHIRRGCVKKLRCQYCNSIKFVPARDREESPFSSLSDEN